MKGYKGTGLFINLTEKKSKELNISREFAKIFIGGRGFGAKIIHDNVGDIQAFDPDNLIVMATGPLTGVLAPGSPKTSFSFISPATNIYGDSNIGSRIGLELKKAGYDFIVIRGKASSPTLLKIFDNEVVFEDASSYWGKKTFESADKILEDIGLSSKECTITTIGPAGEKMLACASVQSENRFAGRTGLGAVFGSKNLKALAISGSQPIEISDQIKLMKIYKEVNEFFNEHPNTEYFQKFGTLGLLEGVNEHGIMPINNFQEGFIEELGNLTVEGYSAMVRNQVTQTCLYCPATCEGVFKKNGKKRIRPQYESLVMLGPNLGIYDLDFCIEANHLLNEMGMDTISVGNLIGLLMEAYEKGHVPKEYFDGLKLNFGNKEGAWTLIHKMVKREGIGNIMANGIKALIKKFPKLEKISLHSKYLEQSGYDTRSLYGQCLAYSTSDIGAHHNRAWTAYHELKCENSNDDLASLVIFHQHVRPLMDCLGVCRFPWIEFDIDLKFYERFYESATGFKATIEDLLKRSEGIYNLTRLINIRRGLKRKDDFPPWKVYSVPIPSGPNKGKMIDLKRYEALLDLYYLKRNWDKKGIPKEDHVKNLKILNEDFKIPR
ncbi:MAG: aldehyde ferredoxin oxidoreductase family protein [Candidatus Helarchaeota archaeon]